MADLTQARLYVPSDADNTGLKRQRVENPQVLTLFCRLKL